MAKTTKKKAVAAGKKPTRGKQGEASYQVFVSHATGDKWIATTFCEKIEETGATIFRDDRDIDGGDTIPEKIRTEIKVSRELVVLLTPESIDRPWVLLEVGAAGSGSGWKWERLWSQRKNYRITPILCHVSVDVIPGIILGRKAFDINEFDQYLAGLKHRVKK